MASNQYGENEMETEYQNMNMGEDEDGFLMYEGETEDLEEFDDRWCLVGRFLTERTIDFQAMQHKMASLWRPVRGLFVKELDPNRFLFQFYHEMDIERVIEGSPWTFDRVPLVFERLKSGDNPRMVVLNHLDFWVQLHEMTSGFKSVTVVKDIGNYIGKFQKTDPNDFKGVWRDYLRVRVSVCVDAPLKKRMRLQMKNGPICNVKFKYEDLTTFCFVCGVLGHSERFCEKAFDTPPHLLTKPYNIELKAAPCRRNHTIGSKWLKPTMAKREENPAPYVGIPTSVLRPSMAGNQGSVIGGNHGENSIISDGDREIVAEEIRREIDGSKESQLGVSKKGKTINESFMGGDMEEDAVVNIIDLKRRRFECEGLIGPNTENVNVGQSSTVAEVEDRNMLEQEDGIFQKNLNGAGTVLQARQEL
ncbi:uncharacterized protein LOC115696660 [Cannabis sativa]|uniref:uncharacterized protein LOC115696660 n=1 Tax=Cannabis sativa TaxID=3483 RepID=UPI0029CA714E|nr:uncharacterized protein LOC115696660 [Cannabis sativa]